MPVLHLQEWTRHHLYSAFVVSEQLPQDFNLMDRRRAMPMLGADDETVGRIHTSLVRSGLAGLPRNWEFFALAWHFSINRALTEQILEWASEVNVEFLYNHKRYGESPLHELLHGELSLAGDDIKLIDDRRWAGIPIWMRENLPYELRVDASSKHAQLAKEKLLSALSGQRLVVWGYISGYLKREVV
jgi:hypothetical protein